MSASREQVEEWVRRYEQAWRTPGTDAARALFTAGATYRAAPYEEPHRGHDAIAAMWERERAGPDEEFAMSSEIVAVDDGTAVVRVEVRYGGSRPQEYRDLWVIALDDEGRARAFEEWPFWPEQGRAAPGPNAPP